MSSAIRAETRFIPGSLEPPGLPGARQRGRHHRCGRARSCSDRPYGPSIEPDAPPLPTRRRSQLFAVWVATARSSTWALDARLEKLAPNPRMASQVDRLRQRLGHRCAEMRQAIQALVSQSPIIHTKPDVAGVRSADHPVSSRLAVGTHPEATLVAQADRFTGRLDLLAVHPDHADIIDFKTGEHSQRHTRQLQLYGLLWVLDEKANPDSLPVRSLTLAYVTDRATVTVPDDWEALRAGLHEEIAAADDLVRQRPPLASPSAECWHCPVRQMCDEYWRSTFIDRDPGVIVTDAEVRILSRNGPTSWRGTLGADGADVLVRTSHDADFPTRKELTNPESAGQQG